MNITKIMKQGQIVGCILENSNGMSVEIGTMGAAIRSIELPTADGGKVNVCLRLADDADYAGNGLYAGASVAPVAGRISDSRCVISGREYVLQPNENGITSLHGGAVCGSFVEWTIMQAYAKDGVAKVGMTTILPDGLEGFPGTRIFSATYTLDENNRLTVDYDAVSDQDTYVNMTNHAYFNMSGDFTRSAWDQMLTIAAPNYMVTDDNNLPIGLAAVEGTPFDFRGGKTVREAVDTKSSNHQIAKVNGLDHGFDVRQAAAEGQMLLQLTDPDSGRSVKISSQTGECVVVYSGGFIGDGYVLEGGLPSFHGCAIALECQAFPNAINLPELDAFILKEGKNYHHTICYDFEF